MSVVVSKPILRLVAAVSAALAVIFVVAAWSTVATRATPAWGEERAPGFDQHAPAAALVGEGRYLLTWVEDRGSGSDVYGKTLLSNGRAVGGAGRAGRLVIREAADPLHGPRFDPHMAGTVSPPGVYLVWSEARSQTEGHDIYGVQVSLSGWSIGTPELLAGGVGDQRRPFVLAAGRQLLLVWDDDTRDRTEIWGRLLSATSRSPRGEAFPIVQGPGDAEAAHVLLFAPRDHGWT